MKNLFIQISCVALVSLSIISCSKDDDNTNMSKKDYSDAVADEIAASSSTVSSEATGTSSSYSEYSATQTKSAFFYVMQSTTLDTVFHKNKTLSKSNSPSDPYTYSFTYNLNFGVVYNNGVIDNFFYNSNGNGNYNGIVVKASVNESSNWILTGLNPSSKSFILNGTGLFESNSVNQAKEDTIVSTSNIKFQNVTYDKTTEEIIGGTLIWDISGTVNGESFSYNAVLEYTSDVKAELTLSDKKYYINISTGKVEN
jgi:hypothetical protein